MYSNKIKLQRRLQLINLYKRHCLRPVLHSVEHTQNYKKLVSVRSWRKVRGWPGNRWRRIVCVSVNIRLSYLMLLRATNKQTRRKDRVTVCGWRNLSNFHLYDHYSLTNINQLHIKFQVIPGTFLICHCMVEVSSYDPQTWLPSFKYVQLFLLISHYI